MTIGIYSLYWENSDLFYIGQSSNIEARFNKHTSSLNSGTHFNYKVQHMYTLYGLPKLFILEETSLENIDNAEAYWINEFNSLKEGLNILEGGSMPKGYKHPNAKYSKYTVLKVFSLLYSTILPYKNIASKLKVNIGLVSSIAQGTSHLWLKEVYSEKYNTMQNKCKERAHLRPTTDIRYKYSDLKILSKEGIIYSIENISKFCREHPDIFNNYNSDRSQLAAALRNNRSFKGFTFIKG